MTFERQPTRSVAADWLRALERTADVTPGSTRTLATIAEEFGASRPDHPALIGPDESLSYGDLSKIIRQVARWAIEEGLRPGDRVAMVMANAPAYPAIWLGLSRVGIVTALINTALTGESLRHCLGEASPRLVICGSDYIAALRSAGLSSDMPLWCWDAHDACVLCLAERIAAMESTPLEAPPSITLRDPALLIYTSGTTGLPKAAHVSHHRVALWSRWFAAITDARPDDRLYDCLPMYHSVGGVVAVGAMLASGGTVIVRNGFSASNFWCDVAASGATIFQYIGELCRYLVAAPAGEMERRHHLRLCCGNGLRADVWQVFADRFAISRIVEFYAATEASFSLFNLEGKVGAIGRIPSFMAHRNPVAIVRHDPDGGVPPRGPDGFCRRCEVDEPGEAIGKLGDGAGSFEGYTSAQASEKKVLENVFRPGDRWFRTGDLMARDSQGFYSFVDRLGDTFRWKGENVATAQVENVLRACPGVIDAIVYGVIVPGTDGRAGMAAIVADADLALADVVEAVTALPRYARPLFLRLCDALQTTGTFRPMKAELAAAGFKNKGNGNRVYLLQQQHYALLDPLLEARIAAADPEVLRRL